MQLFDLDSQLNVEMKEIDDFAKWVWIKSELKLVHILHSVFGKKAKSFFCNFRFWFWHMFQLSSTFMVDAFVTRLNLRQIVIFLLKNCWYSNLCASCIKQLLANVAWLSWCYFCKHYFHLSPRHQSETSVDEKDGHCFTVTRNVGMFFIYNLQLIMKLFTRKN